MGDDSPMQSAAPAAPATPATTSMPDPFAAESTVPSLRGPLDAGSPPQRETVGVPDAASGRRLECRAECECELRDGLDFMFCDTTLSFAEAAARCQQAGGALASVADAAQNDWFTEQMQARDADDFWLSGTDAQVEGTWRWADGTIFHPPEQADADPPFAPWDAQQPNDLNGEDCMRSIGGVWRDLACDAQLTYVCQG